MTGPRTIRLVTEWSTDDPALAQTLALIAATPTWDPLRHEMEAALHTFQARLAWQRAAELRAAARQAARPRRTAGPGDARKQVQKGSCPNCGATVRLRKDGTVRVHDVGSGAAASRAITGAANRCVGAGLPPT